MPVLSTLTPFTVQVMPKLALPWPVVLAGGYLIWRFFAGKKGEMNAERKAAFAVGMRLTDPQKLNLLADGFDKANLPEQAEALRNRANLSKVPAGKQSQRANIVKQALSSTNPDAVETVADAFQNEGAIATADLLRSYAIGLRQTKTIRPTVIEPPPPAPPPIQDEAPPESQDSEVANAQPAS